jgi:hypothetical protein
MEPDDYISLSVGFVPVGSVRPVYYRAHGHGDGEMELKLEPLTGEVIGPVVIRAEGRIIDDASLAGGGTYSGGELLVRAAGARNGPSRTPLPHSAATVGRIRLRTSLGRLFCK